MKPKAIIVDIDGTLADCSHRVHHIQQTPKDWDAFYAGCGEDRRIDHVFDIVYGVQFTYGDSLRTILVTGRPKRSYAATFMWLQSNHIRHDYIYMRPDGDHRADDVLKREIYERDIAPHYDVLFALEDRSRVVKMYRSLGVPCLQVAEGDF